LPHPSSLAKWNDYLKNPNVDKYRKTKRTCSRFNHNIPLWLFQDIRIIVGDIMLPNELVNFR
jgi:hypothetical protein